MPRGKEKALDRRRYSRFTLVQTWTGQLASGHDVLIDAVCDDRIWVTAADPLPADEAVILDLPLPSGVVALQALASECAAVVESDSVRHRARLDVTTFARERSRDIDRHPRCAVLWRSRRVNVAQISRGGCVVEGDRALCSGAVGRLTLVSADDRTFEDGVRVVWSRLPEGTSFCRAGLELLPIDRSARSIRAALAALDLPTDF